MAAELPQAQMYGPVRVPSAAQMRGIYSLHPRPQTMLALDARVGTDRDRTKAEGKRLGSPRRALSGRDVSAIIMWTVSGHLVAVAPTTGPGRRTWFASLSRPSGDAAPLCAALSAHRHHESQLMILLVIGRAVTRAGHYTHLRPAGYGRDRARWSSAHPTGRRPWADLMRPAQTTRSGAAPPVGTRPPPRQRRDDG